MQIRWDSLLLQRTSLIGPASGDQRKRRAVLADDVELLLAKFRRHESKDADAPGHRTHPVLSLGQQRFHFGPSQKSQSQEWQAAFFGHSRAKFRYVADPRHRPL